jgi:hypothetical protein
VRNQQRSRTLQQIRTTLAPAEVLAAAKEFFAQRSNIYSAFPELVGPTYLTLRGLGGEEIAIGVSAADGGTNVSASSYMFDQQVARFLSSLPPVVEAGEGTRQGALAVT